MHFKKKLWRKGYRENTRCSGVYSIACTLFCFKNQKLRKIFIHRLCRVTFVADMVIKPFCIISKQNMLTNMRNFSHSSLKRESPMSHGLVIVRPSFIFQFTPPVKWVSERTRQKLCCMDVYLTYRVQ